MKIYINRRPVDGAWGGGNRFLKALVQGLGRRGHSVSYNLTESDIDKYVCFDPRPNDRGESYENIFDASRSTGGKLIQRVGDIGSHGKPALRKMVELSVGRSDEVIFVSEWARNSINYNGPCQVIYNNPVPEFAAARKLPREIEGDVKIVTHHWSDNLMKGFDIYRALDKWIGENGGIEFTYCGRWPKELGGLKNSKHIQPLDHSEDIAELITESDIYLTASLSEPSGNHAIEAKFTGLPILYHSMGGGIVEYCRDFGTPYSNLDGLIKAIEKWKPLLVRELNYERALHLKDTIEETIAQYIEVIEK